MNAAMFKRVLPLIGLVVLMGLTREARAQVGTLSVEGPCPGEMTVKVTDGYSERLYIIVFGFHEGNTVIPPPYGCSGTVLGIQGGVRLVRGVRTDRSGTLVLLATAPHRACGAFLQAFETFRCETTNVVQIAP